MVGGAARRAAAGAARRVADGGSLLIDNMLRSRGAVTGTFRRECNHGVAVLLGAVCAVGLGVGAVPTWGQGGLADRVPADVGLYIELRNAADLIAPLVEPELWLSVAALAGQPAKLPDTVQWQERVRQTLGMMPAQAVQVLFAREAAFAAASLRDTHDAVILCRPSEAPRDLVARWNAQPLPMAGRTAVYRLPNNVGVAVHDELLVFGDLAARGLFERVVARLDGAEGVALADDEVFRRLSARAPRRSDGMLFARTGALGSPLVTVGSDPAEPSGADAAAVTQPATAPGVAESAATAPVPATGTPAWPDVPRILRGSRHFLLALERDGALLRISAVGDGVVGVRPADHGLRTITAKLPERTLLSWAGRLDLAALAARALELPEGSVLRVAYEVHQRPGTVERLTEALDASVCLAVGVVAPGGRTLAAPPVPAVAAILGTRDAATAERAWSDLFHHSLAVYRLLALTLPNSPSVPDVETLVFDDVRVELLNLSFVLGPTPDATALGELHLCWAMHEGALIVASHVDWLRQIVRARQGHGATLAPVLELVRGGAAGREETVITAQLGPVADLGQMWIEWLNRVAPAVLHENWWRNYQPGGGQVSLGVQVIVDVEQRRLRIHSVHPGGPSDGVLRTGDAIVGINRVRFATDDPVREVRRGLALRPDARWVDLLVERERRVLARRVRLPFVDPVETLRRLIAAGSLLQRVVYIDDVPDASGSRGQLTLEMRQGAKPLIDFGQLGVDPGDGQPTKE